jgi:voltage-gated potassium channel
LSIFVASSSWLPRIAVQRRNGNGQSDGDDHLSELGSFTLLVLSIPAFYLHLAATEAKWWRAGSALYLIVALGFAALMIGRRSGTPLWPVQGLNFLVFIGALASLAGNMAPWSTPEWAMRIALVILIALRILICMRPMLRSGATGPIWIFAAITLFLSGLGFYWLEPTVNSYADGLWLAFVSGATVGYGDIVPTTPASRIFAVFMVLLGYAMLSLVTASIAAMFVGEDEKQIRREMHRDIRSLQIEVRHLREELAKSSGKLVECHAQRPDGMA